MLEKMRLGEGVHRHVRSAVGAVCCVAGLTIFFRMTSPHYPPSTWLAWRIGGLVAWTTLLCVACVASGALVLQRLLAGVVLPRLEAAVLSMAAGLVVFTLGMYGGGACAWFGPGFAVSLALALALLGAPSAWRLLLRPQMGASSPDRSWLATAAFAAGVVGVGLVYLGMLTPEALNYDATWSHLTIAQDYAREGRIVPFPGDYNKQVPHLASMVYAWGFMVPGLDVLGRWMLAQHIEFALFIWTLAGVAAAVRWAVQAPVRGAWAAFFLFPSIFVYDANLGAAADHVLAFFGPPVLLAARHFFTAPTAGRAVLLGLIVGGAALTKYQALYFVVPLLGLVALHTSARLFTAWKVDRRFAVGVFVGPAVLLATCALVVSPHFLKNVLFHGNPVYPFMQGAFAGSHPLAPSSELLFRNVYLDQAWVPKGTWLEKIRSSFELFFTFSFVPHYSFHGSLPTFGSLFTLLLPCLLVVPARRRLLFVLALAAGGLFTWAWTFRVDRNLQIILPLMVVLTGAIIVEVWRLGLLARLALVPLLVFQVVWGADAAFLSGHVRIKDSIDLIRSGAAGTARTRFRKYREVFRALDQALPKNAYLLVHAGHSTLGIDRRLILDWAGFQALVHYEHVRSPRELHAYYRKLGVTHVLYVPQERLASSKQEEILIHDLMWRYAPLVRRFGHFRLLELPRDPPPATPPGRVLCLGLEGYADGFYDLGDLDAQEYLPFELRRYRPPREPAPTLEAVRARLGTADALLIGPRGGHEGTLFGELRRFDSVGRFPGSFGVYLRRR